MNIVGKIPNIMGKNFSQNIYINKQILNKYIFIHKHTEHRILVGSTRKEAKSENFFRLRQRVRIIQMIRVFRTVNKKSGCESKMRKDDKTASFFRFTRGEQFRHDFHSSE